MVTSQQAETVAAAEEPGADALWHGARRGRMGWYCYDWASAVFTTTVTSIFFGPFITRICEHAADGEGRVHPIGIPVLASSYFPFLVGTAVFLQLFALPWAAALTERFDKGVLLGGLGFCGAGAAISMYAIGETDYLLGGALFVIATMALGASIMVANTYLPALAPPERQDRTSTQGSAAGFLSGGLVLVADLLVYANHGDLGLTESQAVRVILLVTGGWWLMFGGVALWLLRGYGAPQPPVQEPVTSPQRRRIGTYSALLTAVRRLREFPGAGWFLVAFLLYNNGMQSVTALVGTFAVEELHIAQQDVVVSVLLVQFVAFGGAVIAGRLAERYGGRTVLLSLLAMWFCAVLTGGFIPDRSFGAFTALCVGAGFVIGGTYALSRSVFLGLVPEDRMPEYFGIFETVNRCLGFLGPAVFGAVLQWTGSYRTAWLSILLFFLAGALALAPGALSRRGWEREQGGRAHG